MWWNFVGSVCGRGLYVHVCTVCVVHLRLDATVECPDVSLHLVPLRHGLFLNLELGRQPETPSNPLPPPTGTPRVTDTHVGLASYVGAGDSDSGPHVTNPLRHWTISLAPTMMLWPTARLFSTALKLTYTSVISRSYYSIVRTVKIYFAIFKWTCGHYVISDL